MNSLYKYRDEFKYICHEWDLRVLGHRLNNLMERDVHQKGQSYRIRSLYFDDYYDTAMFENDVGTDNRRKFRIRVYDEIKDRINLEIKYKIKGKTRKESCILTSDQLADILNCKLPFDSSYSKPLMLLYIETKLHRMVPKIIVEYERSAYVYKHGNVRVTFDRNISFSRNISDFTEDKIDLIPLLPSNKHVLEVKYDEFLPDYIAQILELGNMEKTAFSKYYLSRLYSEGVIEHE